MSPDETSAVTGAEEKKRPVLQAEELFGDLSSTADPVSDAAGAASIALDLALSTARFHIQRRQYQLAERALLDTLDILAVHPDHAKATELLNELRATLARRRLEQHAAVAGSAKR